jgi:ribA/ribD-fused uncharacterized protein
MSWIFFWGENKEYGQFSNFFPSEFTVDGVKYNCSEQYFMKKKQELFDKSNEKLSKEILQEQNPKKIKEYGRKVKNFNEDLWNLHKYKIMLDANYHKYSQNPQLLQMLLNSKDSILVEASPFDRIWGIGYNKKNALENKNNWGQNLLGKVLMELRSKLAQ